MQTIKNSLNTATNRLLPTSASALLDAEILLCHVLQKDRSYLRAWSDKTLSEQEVIAFNGLINKRKHGEPIAYLTGIREFWSREFFVNPDVLIPRPETELLVELSLKFLPNDRPQHILDLGTGSGILAITLADERPHTQVTAADISAAALAVAKRNAEKHQVNNVRFIESDWFANIPEGRFDLIVSNPPYVAEGDPHLTEGDLRFEPRTALVANDQGLADITTIAEHARQRLTSGGVLMFEHGFQQGKDVRYLLTLLGYAEVCTHYDLAGLPRVTAGRWTA